MDFDATFPFDLSHPKGREQMERAARRYADVVIRSKVDGEAWLELASACEALHWIAHRLHSADKAAELRHLAAGHGEREAR